MVAFSRLTAASWTRPASRYCHPHEEEHVGAGRVRLRRAGEVLGGQCRVALGRRQPSPRQPHPGGLALGPDGARDLRRGVVVPLLLRPGPGPRQERGDVARRAVQRLSRLALRLGRLAGLDEDLGQQRARAGVPGLDLDRAAELRLGLAPSLLPGEDRSDGPMGGRRLRGRQLHPEAAAQVGQGQGVLAELAVEQAASPVERARGPPLLGLGVCGERLVHLSRLRPRGRRQEQDLRVVRRRLARGLEHGQRLAGLLLPDEVVGEGDPVLHVQGGVAARRRGPPGLARLQPPELRELLRGVGVAAQRGIDPSQLVARARVIGVHGDRLLEQAEGGRLAAAPKLHGPQPVQGLDGARIALQRLLELRLRLHQVALAEPGPADQEVRAGMAGLETKARGRPLARVREAGQVVIRPGEQQQGLAAPGLERGQALQRLRRLGVRSPLGAALVRRAQRLAVGRVALEQRPERLPGLVVPPGRHQRPADPPRDLPVVRPGLLQLAVGGERALVVLRLEGEAGAQLPRGRVVRRALQERLHVAARVREPSQARLDRGQAEVGLAEGGVELDGALELHARVLEPVPPRNRSRPSSACACADSGAMETACCRTGIGLEDSGRPRSGGPPCPGATAGGCGRSSARRGTRPGPAAPGPRAGSSIPAAWCDSAVWGPAPARAAAARTAQARKATILMAPASGPPLPRPPRRDRRGRR